MIINCEACGKRYLVDETVLGVAGRTLKCTACGHRWHQKPTLPEQTLSDNLMADRKEAPQRAPKKGWVSATGLLVILLISLMGGGYFARTSVMATWPQAEKIYHLLGIEAASPSHSNLRLEALRPLNLSQEMDTKKIMALRGEIFNPTEKVENLKSLTIAVEGDCAEAPWMERALVKAKNMLQKTKHACRVFSWRHDLTETRILPGDRVVFETVPHPLPKSASRLLVDF